MAPHHANSNQSAPIVSQDLQPSTAVGFQQQGTVDWTRVMSASVTFSVDVLSRLSKAGVEAFTIYAAKAIFSNVKLGPNGELRLHEALDKLSAFPSFGKVLWLGFGVKHIIWSMQESTEGLNCLGICACLVEGYSTIDAAKIIRELFLLYDPPTELSPALRQWAALVDTSAGLLASSEFGLVLHGLTKLSLRDGQRNEQYAGSPKDIALVLKEVFEVSMGRVDRLFLSGGADCFWIAAVAHWLLDLRVEVRDQDGTIIYRPDGTRSESSQDSQIIITYCETQSSKILRVNRKHHFIPSGKMLFGYIPTEGMLSCGRVSWESCLVDTFGRPMRLLLGSQARSTGTCLGSAARIFQAIMRDGEGHAEFADRDGRGMSFSPISESSYGRGFYLLARRLLPELSQNPVLHQTMEESMNKGCSDATQQYSQSYASLSQLCSCKNCRSHARDEKGIIDFCLLILIPTICNLVRAMATICMRKDLELLPTRSGLEWLYWKWDNAMRAPNGLVHDPVTDGLLKPWCEHPLDVAQVLFVGREYPSVILDHVAAASQSGLCFCLNTLTEITSDPQEACLVTVVPGRIEWNDFVYSVVCDKKQGRMFPAEETGYKALSMTTITTYDGLADSSTPGLNVELTIEEEFPASNKLSAIYRVSSASFPGRHFLIGAADIWESLNSAFTATSCEGKTCGSLAGFQTILVEGEGVLRETPDWRATRLPITRVLSAQDISVWVALSQSYLRITHGVTKNESESLVFLFHRLQGKQCVRCCILNTENARMGSDERGECPVSIITSI